MKTLLISILLATQIATGDVLYGPAANPGVTNIAGRPVSGEAPSSGEVITWNSSTGQWEPAAGGGGGGVNSDLSNLTSPTAINAAVFAFNAGANQFMRTANNGSGASFNFTLLTGTGTTGTGSLNLSSGAASSGTSGGLNLATGTGTASTGAISIVSGAGSTGSGAVTLASGVASAGTSGAATMRSANQTGNFNSGAANLLSGNISGAGATGASGSVFMSSGSTVDGNSGALTINSGSPSGTGGSGSLTMRSGTTVDGNSGALSIFSGPSNGTGNTGALDFHSGTSTDGQSGDVSVASGNANGAAITGNLLLTTGTNFGSGDSGSVVVTTGEAPGLRGGIYLVDGTEGTSGECWISDGTGGKGKWDTCPGGGVTYPLNAPTGVLADPPSYGFAGGDNDTGIYSTGDGNVSMQANGFLRFQVDQNETTVTGPLIVTGDISANNYPPTGTANRMTYFNGSGDIDDSLWQMDTDGLLYLNANAATTNYRPLYMDITNVATASDDMTGIGINNQADVTDALTQLYVNSSGAVGGNFSGMNLGHSGPVTGNSTLQTLNNSGAIGGEFQGVRLENNANVTNGLTMQSLYNNGTFGGQIRFMEASNGTGGTGPGGIFYNLGNQAAMSGDWTMLNVGDSGVHTGNQTLLNLNVSGDLTGNRTLIGASASDDVSGNVNMLTLGYNGTPTVGGSFLGANIYNSAIVTGNSLGMSVSEGSNADGKTGVAISVSGTSTDYVTGLSVNVDTATAVSQKVAASFGGGAFNSNSPINTSEFTLAAAYSNNSLGGQLNIENGSPITGLFGFGNALAVNILADDNMTADNLLGSSSFGFSVNGFVNQVAVTSGHTIDTLNYMAAGGSYPVQSTGGTVTNLAMFRALGVINGGGTLTIANEIQFHADAAVDAGSPTNLWAFRADSTNADNWFAKNLVVGGSTKQPTNASVGVEIAGTTKSLLLSRMNSTQEGALTAADGMMIYNTTLDKFRCYENGAWIDCNGGLSTSHIYVDTGNGFGSTNTNVRRFSNTRVTVGSDISFTDDAGLGSFFTINTTGVYSISFSDASNSASSETGITVNGSDLSSAPSGQTYAEGRRGICSAPTNIFCNVSITIPLTAGDVVSPVGSSNNNISNDAVAISITRVQ